VEAVPVRPKRAAPLHSESRARLLRAADGHPVSERLLAYLVIEEGLSVHQAVALQSADIVDEAVIVMTKTGKRESRQLSPPTVAVVHAARRDGAPSAVLITGRSGRALSAAAARQMLLGLAREADVPVRSIHQLPRRRIAVAA
jgi:integrase